MSEYRKQFTEQLCDAAVSVLRTKDYPPNIYLGGNRDYKARYLKHVEKFTGRFAHFIEAKQSDEVIWHYSTKDYKEDVVKVLSGVTLSDRPSKHKEAVELMVELAKDLVQQDEWSLPRHG